MAQFLILGSLVVGAFASNITLTLDDEGVHIRPGAQWTKADGQCGEAGHAGGFHHNSGVVDTEDFAVWDFSIPKDGCYWVEEFHPDTSTCGFGLHEYVPVHIDFCKGMHTGGFVDQSTHAGQWNKLVRLPYYTSHSAQIRISARGLCDRLRHLAHGVWAADAFRLTWDGTDNCQLEDVEKDNAIEPTVESDSDAKTAPEAIVTAAAAEEPKEKEEAKAGLALKELPLHQTLVDDLEAEILGSTREPLAECPVTAGGTFHHDGLQKGRRAEATFHFDPPRGGCYLIEEMHAQLEQCKASANTKVRVNYGTGLEAVGTVNQSANAGQWTFIAARPFYAGRPGKVTLSNEGTESGTLSMFDQVRFTWSGKSCSKVDAHPRRAEIRMTVNFEKVAHWLPDFAKSFKAKLAGIADVPEESLRLIGLRPGSIIAEFLVLPSIVDGPVTSHLNALQIIERLSSAVAENTAEICALTGTPVSAGCGVELKDLGVAVASVTTMPEQQTEQQKEQEAETAENENGNVIGAVCAGALGLLSILVGCFFLAKFRKAKKEAPHATNANSTVENTTEASMEEGKSVEKMVVEGNFVDEKKAEDMSDNNSTTCPSSDAQSDSPVVDHADVHLNENGEGPHIGNVD